MAEEKYHPFLFTYDMFAECFIRKIGLTIPLVMSEIELRPQLHFSHREVYHSSSNSFKIA